MDVEWALGKLDQFIGHAALEGRVPDPFLGVLDDQRTTHAPHDVLVQEAQLVEQVLDRVVPGWQAKVPEDRTGRWQQHREAAQRARMQLQSQAEIDERLGDNAPRLDASRFHEWAWEGARSMWRTRHYGQAVVDALKRVNAEAQNKSTRHDVSETDLFNQLFSVDPPSSRAPRFRLMADDGSDTFRSRHRGARALAEGLFAGIRNVVSHTVQETEADEQRALEQLAAVSVLARWVAEAAVVRAPGAR